MGTTVKLKAPRRQRTVGGSFPPNASRMANVKRQPDLSTFRGRLADNVRTRREKLGLSQAGLVEALSAQGLDVSVQSISAYEVGTRAISIDDLPAFAAALKTTVRKLVPEA